MYFAPTEFGHFVLPINCCISKIHFHTILKYVKDMSPDWRESRLLGRDGRKAGKWIEQIPEPFASNYFTKNCFATFSAFLLSE